MANKDDGNKAKNPGDDGAVLDTPEREESGDHHECHIEQQFSELNTGMARLEEQFAVFQKDMAAIKKGIKAVSAQKGPTAPPVEHVRGGGPSMRMLRTGGL